MVTITENITPRRWAGKVAHALDPHTHTGKLLIHLLRHGHITQLEAWELYRIHRLAARVHDLKQKGVVIQRNTLTDPTGVRYVRYALV